MRVGRNKPTQTQLAIPPVCGICSANKAIIVTFTILTLIRQRRRRGCRRQRRNLWQEKVVSHTPLVLDFSSTGHTVNEEFAIARCRKALARPVLSRTEPGTCPGRRCDFYVPIKAFMHLWVNWCTFSGETFDCFGVGMSMAIKTLHPSPSRPVH